MSNAMFAQRVNKLSNEIDWVTTELDLPRITAWGRVHTMISIFQEVTMDGGDTSPDEARRSIAHADTWEVYAQRLNSLREADVWRIFVDLEGWRRKPHAVGMSMTDDAISVILDIAEDVWDRLADKVYATPSA